MSPTTLPVITIDGPSGSGKGTVAREVAQELGFHLLDSGALYRVLGLAAQRRGVALDDEPALADLARDLDVVFLPAGAEEPRILLAGEDLSDVIRSEQCGAWASQVAALGAVREALLARQRGFLTPPGLVADGRDMGTVVFPDAGLKIFLTASVERRAERRYKQLKEKGIDVNLRTISEEISARDARDAARPVAPLKPAADANIIDTTELTVGFVVQHVLELAGRRQLV